MAAALIAPPRRFRRRLFWTLVLTAVLPVVAIAAVGVRVLDEVLALSLSPVEHVLESTATSLESRGQARPPELAEAQLLVAQAELAREALRRLTLWSFGAVTLAALALASLAAALLGRRFSRPVTALTSGIAKVAGGDLGAQVPAEPRPDADELAFLIEQFNRMTRQLQEQRARLEVTERLAAWQEVARALAHELKNPLTAMKMALARIARIDPSAPENVNRAKVSESVSLLEDQVDALMRMTQSFSDFARLPAAAPVILPLPALCEEVARLYAADSRRVTVTPAAPAVKVRADPDQLRRALANLVKNALEASPADTPVEITVTAERALAAISVRDHGGGAPEPLLRGRFLEGLSQKPGGSGLGLPITQKIIHDHGGELAFARAPDRGTIATVRLPRVEEA